MQPASAASGAFQGLKIPRGPSAAGILKGSLRRRTLLLGLTTGGLTAGSGQAAPQAIRATDGVAVTGDALPAQGRRRGTILLFHMAGSNLGEYATIAPELNRRGFDTLAIDQRSGGAGFGRGNETAARLGRDPGYRAALPDLEGALAWAQGRGPVLAWGSSYSAALVFFLAAQAQPPLAGVLAFSPGEYFAGVRAAAARVTCPVFVSSSEDAGEIQAAAGLLAATQARVKRQFRPAFGQHGSSLLRADRNPRGAAAAWSAVGGFLDEVLPG
jgi:pimeloyl-ACP methyl ester carboxylesterase